MDEIKHKETMMHLEFVVSERRKAAMNVAEKGDAMRLQFLMGEINAYEDVIQMLKRK